MNTKRSGGAAASLEMSEMQTRGPLAFRPVLTDGLAFSDCLHYSTGIMHVKRFLVYTLA